MSVNVEQMQKLGNQFYDELGLMIDLACDESKEAFARWSESGLDSDSMALQLADAKYRILRDVRWCYLTSTV